LEKGHFDSRDSEWIIHIKDRHGNPLDLKKGKVHYARDKLDRSNRLEFIVNRVVWGQQSNVPEKVIVIEEIQWLSDNRTEIRFGYYIFSKTGHWWWGQSALMIPKRDLRELLRYAEEKEML